MKNVELVVIATLIALSIQGCRKAKPQTNNNLKYFGFTLVDVGWDDTLDATSKTNYADEVAPFSNIADLLVVSPTDNIVGRLQTMSQHNMKAILHLNDIFFYRSGSGGGLSGSLYDLRPDYKARWDTFVATNNLSASSQIQAFYIGEEPTWNSISFSELKSATDYVKATIPAVPIMVIEAYPIISDLKVPSTVDWLGFDHYFIKDPKNNNTYRNELKAIKAKRSTPSQKIVLVMDAHYIPSKHRDIGEISEAEMASVASNYYELAKSEPDVVALLGYFWPGGFDDPSAKGARQLPQNAKDEITRIGKEITGK